MKRKLFLILSLTLLFVSCERKSLDEQFREAISDCKVSRVTRLLQKGVDADTPACGEETALYFLSGISENIEEHSYEMSELLIQNGADVNFFTTEISSYDDERHILSRIEKSYCVCNCASAAKLDLLLKNGAVVDADCGNNVTPLMYYIESRFGSKEVLAMIRLLLENGADVNHKSDTGVTPLLIALQYSDRETVDLLLEYGAEIHEDYVHYKMNPFRYTAFITYDIEVDYYASELSSICRNGYVDILKGHLQNHKVNLFADSGNGMDCFTSGVHSNNPEMVEFLLPYYGNINSKRYTLFDQDNNPTYGYTLYGIACYFECEKSEQVLLDHGADGFECY